MFRIKTDHLSGSPTNVVILEQRSCPGEGFVDGQPHGPMFWKSHSSPTTLWMQWSTACVAWLRQGLSHQTYHAVVKTCRFTPSNWSKLKQVIYALRTLHESVTLLILFTIITLHYQALTQQKPSENFKETLERCTPEAEAPEGVLADALSAHEKSGRPIVTWRSSEAVDLAVWDAGTAIYKKSWVCAKS